MKLEVCILAGGLSTRFGRDKAGVRLGRRTMLSIIRTAAAELGLPVRTLRRDRVKRCGPLGGVWTALDAARADAVLFLACDMPLVTPALLRRLIRASRQGEQAAFAAQGNRSGFPFVLPRSAIGLVQMQIGTGELSLRTLARRLRAARVRVATSSKVLFNVNTPEEAASAAEFLQKR